MEKGLVSVVVPCYNVEKFIDDCFLSLESQTYKNIEMIFVNDGSTDSTLEKLKDFCSKGEKRILIDKKNGGVSAARNTGLEKANGEFVMLFDSDDCLKSNTIELIMEFLKNDKYDLIVFKDKWIKENFKFKPTEKNRKVPKKHEFGGTDEIMMQMFAGRLGWRCSNKIYRMEILKNFKFFPNVFNEKGCYGEDTEFVSEYITKISKCLLIDEKLYLYRQRKGSLVHSKFNPKKLSVLDGIKKVENLDEEIYKKSQAYFKTRKAMVSLEMLLRMWDSDFRDEKIIKELFSNIKSNIKYIWKGKLNPFYLKIGVPVMVPVLHLRYFKYLKKKKDD